MRFSTGWWEHELFITLMSSRTYSTFLSDSPTPPSLWYSQRHVLICIQLKTPGETSIHLWSALRSSLLSLFCIVNSSLCFHKYSILTPRLRETTDCVAGRNSLGSKPGHLITFSQWSVFCFICWPVSENHFSHFFIQCVCCLRDVFISGDLCNNHHKLGGWKWW